MNSPKSKHVLVGAVVLVSLVIAVGVYYLSSTSHIGSNKKNIETAKVLTPNKVEQSGLRLPPKDDPQIESESVPAVVNEQSQKYSAMVRSEIHRSPTLPVGVAFNNTLRLLDDLNKEDPAYALYYLQDGLGLYETDDANVSKDLLKRMLDSLQTIDSEIKQENRRLACFFGVPSAAGDEAYSILEAIDDTPEIVAKRHLDMLENELGQDAAQKLQQWLNIQKTKITQVKYNYKEYYEANHKSADARLASICNEATEDMK